MHSPVTYTDTSVKSQQTAQAAIIELRQATTALKALTIFERAHGRCTSLEGQEALYKAYQEQIRNLPS